MNWQAGTDKYYLTSGECTICKIGTKPTYELWNRSERIGIFESAELAKQAHATLTKAKND